MQDAGGDRVDEHLEAEDEHEERLPKNQIENDEAHLDPSRWWFASSAFPMIAGTLGPVASAFSICALVRPWRQKYKLGDNMAYLEFINDPQWSLAINGVQLVIAIVANLFLLLNMTKRMRFTIAQPVTIIGWYISSICLIALAATASGPLIYHPENEFIWSQAFYYGIFAAALYFLCSSLMVVTFHGAHVGHYDKDFQLTTSQRTLMLQTIMFLMYLLIGALIFSTIEGWQYLDAVYWADVTLFTVGFGDFSMQTTLGRALLFPYALIGVISLGLVIGSIRSLVLERGRRRLDARMVEKKRRRMLRQMARKGKDDILIPITDEMPGHTAPMSTDTGLSEFARREQEFKLMREIQRRADHRRRWVAMAISTTTWVALWLLGALIFQSCESAYQGWTYYDGFYFAFVSLTTIGYGDVTPASPAGKAFFVFWSLLALPTMTVLISNAGDTVVKGIRDATNQIGNITILPGDHGFRKDLKLLIKTLSCGQLFEEEIEDLPPGFLGQAHSQETLNDDEDDDEEDDDDDDTDIEAHGPEKSTGELDEEVRGVYASAGASARDLETGAAEKEADTGDIDNDGSKTVSAEPSASGNSSPTSPTKGKVKIQEPHKPSEKRPQRSQTDINSQTVKMKRALSIPRQDIPQEVPTNRADLHVVLIDEISRVTQHLKSHPPRKYTFQEWAWYLKLLGEDERSAETHRQARPHTHRKHENKTTNTDGPSQGDGKGSEHASLYHAAAAHFHLGGEVCHGGETKTEDAKATSEDTNKLQWSWVGSRSPLMGSQEEAEWILEKLTQKLAEELRAVRTEDLAREKEEKRAAKDHTRRHE